MLAKFTLTNTVAVLNLELTFCRSKSDILASEGFYKVLDGFLQHLKSTDEPLYDSIKGPLSEDEIVEVLITFFSILRTSPVELVSQQNNYYKELLSNKKELIYFVERFYNFWRRLSRFAFIKSKIHAPRENAEYLIQLVDEFASLVLSLYRDVLIALDPYAHNVFRQLVSGVNGGFSLDYDISIPLTRYDVLNNVPFIETVVLRPPFVTYPSKTTRSGMFSELKTNPIHGLLLNDDEWFCYPAKVGEYLAFVYFHQNYIVHGTALANLFELADREEYIGKKPEIIYLFGVPETNRDPMLGYYFDREFDLLIGYASAQPNIDYFGYMKKMLLTLYNLRQMEEGNLPIHGAMARIVLKNNSSANIIIVGDSGAGKSESLDAFRALAKDYLKTFKIIFDDMGSIKLKDGKVIATGTEIGAFVRLDDLEDGYAFTEMDRAIFMNPDKTNARMIMPITKYQDVMAGYEVDYFLYANNYESKPDKILIYDNIKAAQEIFIAGKRMAKGTTSESGIVQSFFANPFGPAQNEVVARELIKKYFTIMSEQGVKMGEIYTQLGVPGKEKSGPVESAKELFKIINI